jgi:hypothetical protein
MKPNLTASASIWAAGGPQGQRCSFNRTGWRTEKGDNTLSVYLSMAPVFSASLAQQERIYPLQRIYEKRIGARRAWEAGTTSTTLSMSTGKPIKSAKVQIAGIDPDHEARRQLRGSCEVMGCLSGQAPISATSPRVPLPRCPVVMPSAPSGRSRKTSLGRWAGKPVEAGLFERQIGQWLFATSPWSGARVHGIGACGSSSDRLPEERPMCQSKGPPPTRHDILLVAKDVALREKKETAYNNFDSQTINYA